jgi:pyridoxine kinase
MCILNCFAGDKRTELTIRIPKLPSTFTGTGDLFAALLLAWMSHTNNQLKLSLEKVIATLQAVLKRTLHYAKGT